MAEAIVADVSGRLGALGKADTDCLCANQEVERHIDAACAHARDTSHLRDLADNDAIPNQRAASEERVRHDVARTCVAVGLDHHGVVGQVTERLRAGEHDEPFFVFVQTDGLDRRRGGLRHALG
ncbi:hypothetical protein FQZ97_856580 [compost metagenome]